MTGPTRLDHLRIENFRAFPELDLDLHPQLTVIVAPNGGGKTAVLDAMAIAWGEFVYELVESTVVTRYQTTDTRKVMGPDGSMERVSPTVIAATGMVDGRTFVSRGSFRPINRSAWATGGSEKGLTGVAASLQEWLKESTKNKMVAGPTLPIIAYYGTQRLWGSKLLRAPRSRGKSPDTSRLSGYTGSLSSMSRFDFFLDWFERFSQEAQSERTSDTASPHRAAARLSAVRNAVDVVLRPTGWSTLEWDFVERTAVATHPKHGRFPVALLSDGIQNVIGLIADIAHRAARLNPSLGENAARKSPGVVLIDEVDLHLHPTWQQAVVQTLREAFPAIQLVLSTHSPQVLSTVPHDCIRVIESTGSDARISTPSEQTRGVESATVLAGVMGTDPVPPVLEAARLSEYRVLILSGQFESKAAKSLRAQLEAHFGVAHQLIRECDQLIRLERFKRTLPQDIGGSVRSKV